MQTELLIPECPLRDDLSFSIIKKKKRGQYYLVFVESTQSNNHIWLWNTTRISENCARLLKHSSTFCTVFICKQRNPLVHEATRQKLSSLYDHVRHTKLRHRVRQHNTQRGCTIKDKTQGNIVPQISMESRAGGSFPSTLNRATSTNTREYRKYITSQFRTSETLTAALPVLSSLHTYIHHAEISLTDEWRVFPNNIGR